MLYDWISALIVILVFILSVRPLNRAVKWMKGETTFLKTLIVMFVSGLVAGALTAILPFWSGLIAFIVLIWIYRRSFRLKWHRAFMVWILHLIFVIISSIVIGFLLKMLAGISSFVF